MWIETGNGISRIKITNGTYAIVNYSVSDGLICNDTNVHAILKLQNGNILIGTPQGYQTIIPQDILTTSYDANIYLTGIELKSGMTHPDILNGSSLECAQHLSFTEKENSFTLSFSALDLVETDKIKYAYKIHSNWIYAENNKVNLSMLTAGNYTLSVKACNSQGIWSPNVKELKIKILLLGGALGGLIPYIAVSFCASFCPLSAICAYAKSRNKSCRPSRWKMKGSRKSTI